MQMSDKLETDDQHQSLPIPVPIRALSGQTMRRGGLPRAGSFVAEAEAQLSLQYSAQ